MSTNLTRRAVLARTPAAIAAVGSAALPAIAREEIEETYKGDVS
jgi:hypothetical protein